MPFSLPDCDQVFMTYFDRWYQPEDRERKGFPTTRPDAMVVESFRGISPQDASPLTELGQARVKKMVDGMIDAARLDWPTFLALSAPVDIEWIDAFDRFHNRRRVNALIKSSRPDDFSSDFLVRCCEFGAVLGHVLLATQPNLHWVYDWPYWESAVFDPETGQIVAVFHWAIKKFSSYGIDDGFMAKLLACSNMIERERRGQQRIQGE
jgi:hypothetical protein